MSVDPVIDPYRNLRPPDPTPAGEICTCPGNPPIKLMTALGYNPIHCLNCNLEVPPERLRLTLVLAQAIAFWRSSYDAIYQLWLASGAYEAWAAGELSNLSSPANVEGRQVQRALNEIRRCYYWYFQDQGLDYSSPIEDCPSCAKLLELYTGGIFRQLICEECGIVAVG